MSAAAPLRLQLDPGGRQLRVEFADIAEFVFPAEFLRVNSPSAEVQGHGPGERRLVTGRHAVAIAAIEPVGRYAVRLRFDDGHDTGLYSWDVLRSLGLNQDALWRDYLSAVAASGGG